MFMHMQNNRKIFYRLPNNISLSMSKKLRYQLYIRSDKVSTYVNIFRLVKEVNVIIWIYLILWLIYFPI